MAFLSKSGQDYKCPVVLSVDHHRLYLRASVFSKPPVCQLWCYKELVANVGLQSRLFI